MTNNREGGSEVTSFDFDVNAHEAASAAAREGYALGKWCEGSEFGCEFADRAYKAMYEGCTGRPFEWFEGWPGIWSGRYEALRSLGEDGPHYHMVRRTGDVVARGEQD
jgi:hypothetical protein